MRLSREEFDKMKAVALDRLTKRGTIAVWKGTDPKVALSVMFGLEAIHRCEEVSLFVDARRGHAHSGDFGQAQYIIRHNITPVLWEIAHLTYKSEENESNWELQGIINRLNEIEDHIAMLINHASGCAIAAENMTKSEIAALAK